MVEELTSKKSKDLFKVDIFDKLSSFYKSTAGKTYTIMGISIVVLALLLLVAFRPTLITIFELNTKIKQYTSTADKLESKHRDLVELTREYNNMLSEGGNKEQLILLDQAVLPSSPEIDILFYDINSYAVENSMTLEQINVSTQNIPDSLIFSTIEAKQVTISATGTSTAIYDMLEALYSYPRPLIISAVSLQKSETAYLATIQLYTFYYISTGNEIS